MQIKNFIALVVLGLTTLTFADPAKMAKPDSMREKPFSDSKILMTLSTGRIVDIQKRQGAWYQIKSGSKIGWVSMLSVHRSTAPSATTVGSLSKTSTGRSATGIVVNTTGVRGLSAAELKTATFSETAVADLEKHRVSLSEAVAFSALAPVSPQLVPVLGNTTTGGAQ